MLVRVVIEHGILPVTPGREAEFEAAFAEAKPLMAASPGFRRLTLSRGVERPSHYLFVVEWESMEAHVEGFRGSPAFARWKELLHHFYEPEFTGVEHFEPVHTA